MRKQGSVYQAKNVRRNTGNNDDLFAKQLPTADQPNPFDEDQITKVSTKEDLMGEILHFAHQKEYSILFIAGNSKSRPNSKHSSLKTQILHKSFKYIVNKREVYHLSNPCSDQFGKYLTNRDPNKFRIIAEVNTIEDIQRYYLEYINDDEYKIILFIENNRPTKKYLE